MRYPGFLKENGTIGFVSPSFSPSTEPYKSTFKNALKYFESKGHKYILGPNTWVNEGIGISSTPVKCASELVSAYFSDESDVLISCGGGELMCETIAHIDFEQIKQAPPKLFMGYSDNTNFTFLLTTLCDVASVYGPSAPAYGMEPVHMSLVDSYDLLCGRSLTAHNYDLYEKESLKDEEHPYAPLNCTEKVEVKGFVSASDKNRSDSKGEYKSADDISFKGRMIGGCLDCLANLVGTRFDRVSEFVEKYKDDGIIWYLESCDLNVFAMRRAMWELKEAGWFKYAAGFIIGRPLNEEPMMGLDKYGAYLPYTAGCGVPTVMDADIGHVSPMMGILNGSLADVHYFEGDLSIDMGLELV